MATTIIGIFDQYEDARRAAQELSEAGVDRGNVSIIRNEPAGRGYTTYGGKDTQDYETGRSIGDKISDFFGNLFDADDDSTDAANRDLYSESVRRGSVALAVRAEDEEAVDRATDILNDNGAVDVDRRAAQYRAAGYKNYDASAPLYTAEQTQAERTQFDQEGEIALPVIEEQLNIGKRVVQRGGVRVHTRVTERPVEEQVNLREEHVNVERRPVDRAVSETDLANLKTGEFDVTTRAEEAVVGKKSRVVEEVVVGKEVTERTETVSETVRKTDVEVEDFDHSASSGSKS